MGLRMIKTLVNNFNPYRIIACYAIFFVVRAEGSVKHSVRTTGVDPPIEKILGNIIAGAEEDSLLPCKDRSCEGVLHHRNIHEVSASNSQLTLDIHLPNVIKDHAATNIDSGPIQQQLSAHPIFDKNGSAYKMEKPFKNIFTDLPVLAPTSNQIKNEVCRKHSRIFVHQLKRYKLWAMQMYDASAKLPSGVLQGNVNQFGDFDRCLAVSSDEDSDIEGKYCLASVDIEAMPFTDNDIYTLHSAVVLARSHNFIRSTHRNPGNFIPRFTTINWALCVPASCSSSDVQQAMEEALQEYNETSGLSFSVNVDPEMCYVKENKEKTYSVATICTLIFFAAMICVSVAATLMDKGSKMKNNNEKGKIMQIVMAFSMHKNIDALTADLPHEGEINCIHGIRSICTALVFLAHKVITLALNPYSNRVEFSEIATEWWSIIFRASVVYTDSFLLLSGVLTSFNLSKEIERKKQIDWLKKCTARFIRLTPALLALVLFYAFVMEHLGTGPLWNLTIKKNADICKESFWKNVFYIQTFFPFEKMCALHTHHLALDMQLSLLSPLLVTLLWQWRACGMMILLGLYLFSGVLRYLTILQNKLSLVIFHGITVDDLYQTANMSYGKALHRATPYLLGVGLGFLLHKTGKNVYIPKVFVGVGWLLAAYFAYLSLISPYHVAFRDYEYDVYDASLYGAVSPMVWSLALGWVIWACFTGHGGVINKFLSCKSLVMLSRISYAVYLTQFAVFFYNAGVIRASQQFYLTRSVDLVEVVTVIVISVFVTLIFDLPMQEIKSILMGGGKRRLNEVDAGVKCSKEEKCKTY